MARGCREGTLAGRACSPASLRTWVPAWLKIRGPLQPTISQPRRSFCCLHISSHGALTPYQAACPTLAPRALDGWSAHLAPTHLYVVTQRRSGGAKQ